jgi:hypothetical protein
MAGLPGRTTNFGPQVPGISIGTWAASGTGTIVKSSGGALPSYGGMYAFAEARVGTMGVDIYWIGDSGSTGNPSLTTGGSVTIMYETDGITICS